MTEKKSTRSEEKQGKEKDKKVERRNIMKN